MPVFMVSDKARRALLRLVRGPHQQQQGGGEAEPIARLTEEADWGPRRYDDDDDE